MIYFHFSSSVAIPNPRQITKIISAFTSLIVYDLNQITLTLSDLSNQDIIVVNTTDYTDFLIYNPTTCTASIILCNSDGTLTILANNNADLTLKLTRFTFNFRNSPYVGNSNISLSIFDSTKNYLKQKGSFILTVSQTNTLDSSYLSYTSSNPYYN